MPSRVGGPTIASVAQVGPDDVFLGEAEDTEPSSSHGGVDHNARVCHHACPFKQLYPKTTGTRRCSRLEANHSYGWMLASGIRRANKWFSGKWSVRIVNPAASEMEMQTLQKITAVMFGDRSFLKMNMNSGTLRGRTRTQAWNTSLLETKHCLG